MQAAGRAGHRKYRIKVICQTFRRTIGECIKGFIVKHWDSTRFVLHLCKIDPVLTNHNMSFNKKKPPLPTQTNTLRNLQ